MQPRVLTLPDSIRERLEAAERTRPPRGVHPNEHLVREAFFPLHPEPQEREFLEQFQEAFLGMHNGSGCPAVALRNLPEHSALLTDGLVRMIGDGKRRWNTAAILRDDRAQLLHHDYHFKKGKPHKALTILHYLDPGACRQPTIFVTADDVIDAWAEKLQRGSGRHLADCRTELIDRLLKPHNPAGEKPAIARNPNYTPGCGAPEFILLTTFTNNMAYGGENKPDSALTEMDTILRELEKRESKIGTVGTEANTLVIFNQGMLLHARGYAENPNIQSGRTVQLFDTTARVPPTDDVVSHVTANPVSTVNSVSLFGTTLAQWHKR